MKTLLKNHQNKFRNTRIAKRFLLTAIIGLSLFIGYSIIEINKPLIIASIDTAMLIKECKHFEDINEPVDENTKGLCNFIGITLP